MTQTQQKPPTMRFDAFREFLDVWRIVADFGPLSVHQAARLMETDIGRPVCIRRCYRIFNVLQAACLIEQATPPKPSVVRGRIAGTYRATQKIIDCEGEL